MKKSTSIANKTVELNHIQRGIAFDIYKNKSDSKAYYISQTIITFNTNLVIDTFRQAWEYFINMHSDLFSLAITNQLTPERYAVQPSLPLPFFYNDLSSLPIDIQQQQLAQSAEEDLNQSFDLQSPPLIRLLLFKLDKKKYQFIWTKHHLLMDGMGSFLTLKAIFDIYQALVNKNNINTIKITNTLPSQKVQRESDAIEKAFWQNVLKNHQNHGLLFAPANRHSKPIDFDISTENFRISERLTTKIKDYVEKNNSSVNTLLQGALGIVLTTYSNSAQVTFGTVRRFPNRNQYGIGMHTNTLPISLCADPHQSINDYLLSVSEFNQNIRLYATTPLQHIRQWCRISLEQPLFKIVIDYKPKSLADILNDQFPEMQFNTTFHLKIPYLISFEIVQQQSTFLVTLSYDSNYFTKDYVSCIFSSYLNALADLVDPQHQQLKDIATLDRKMQYQILTQWNRQKTIASAYPTFHEYIKAHATRTPNKIALYYDEQAITYKALNHRANQLSHFLRAHGVDIESKIAVSLHTSIDQYIVLLAILKCGATIVPIDPSYPAERIKTMLADAAPIAFITTTQIYNKITDSISIDSILTWKIDQDSHLWDQLNGDNLNLPIPTSAAAYIVFTSGSTGKPKGVIIEHRQWLAMMAGCAHRFDLTKEDRILQINTFGFDVFQADWGLAFTTGATLCLFNNYPFSPQEVISAINKHQVSFINCSSSILASLPKTELPSLKTISIGGEPCPLNTAHFWSQGRNFYHVYGISETAIISTAGKYDATKEILTIGNAVPNTKVYILNDRMEPCPPYVPGEIFIGGDGVARGYLNHPKETEHHFINYKIISCKNQRLYKTGDIARWLPTGEIEFLCRKDDQVKIRGNRVELAEVECVIEQLPNIVVAKVVKDPEMNQLAAYVMSNDYSLSEIKLRQHLVNYLPTYMIPQQIHFVTSLPRTLTGKIDKKSLKHVKPRKNIIATPTNNDSTLSMMINQAKALLSTKEINISSNFFDLGFDSITLTAFQVKIEKLLNIKLNTSDLFIHSNIKSLATYIHQLNPVNIPPNSNEMETMNT